MPRKGENIYKRKDGRYEGRYIKEYSATGKAIYGYIYSKSYCDLKQQLIKLKNTKKTEYKKTNIKLKDFLEKWLVEQNSIKPTTKQVYKSYIKNHINPAIGDVPLKHLNDNIIRSFTSGLRLSPSTVKSIYCVLKSALEQAQQDEMIQKLSIGVKLPRREKSDVRILTKDEQQCLEACLLNDEDIGILICLYTGLRIGELCALKWEDINLENGTLTVKGTQARTDNGLEIISPKSENSIRTIPIPEFLQEKLRNLERHSIFVISHNREHMDVRTYRRHFKKALKSAGLPDIRFHALRHTFATRALEVGMDYKTLSEILGHSSVRITLDLYTHSLYEHKKQEMNKLNFLFN